MGDFATVDYEATIDGQPFTGSQTEGVTAEIAPGELVDSNIAALDGVKVGDTKEIDYAFPPGYRRWQQVILRRRSWKAIPGSSRTTSGHA